MLSYTHLTPEERKILQQLLGEGYSYRRIAAFLGRSPSTISREVKRNRAKFRPKAAIHNPYWYNCWRAQNLYVRRRRSRAGSAIPGDSEAWNYVLRKLAEYWSPEAICGRWRMEHLRKRIGDWEGDTVYGGVGKGLLITLVDRKSRFLCAGLLAKRNALLTKDTLVQLLSGLPVESVSLHNGSEFSEFHAMEQELNAPVYFAEPHKPWQRK